jgi:hypothetical protein
MNKKHRNLMEILVRRKERSKKTRQDTETDRQTQTHSREMLILTSGVGGCGGKRFNATT